MSTIGPFESFLVIFETPDTTHDGTTFGPLDQLRNLLQLRSVGLHDEEENVNILCRTANRSHLLWRLDNADQQTTVVNRLPCIFTDLSATAGNDDVDLILGVLTPLAKVDRAILDGLFRPKAFYLWKRKISQCR